MHTQAKGATQRRCLCARFSAPAALRPMEPAVEALGRVRRLVEWTKGTADMEMVRRELGVIEALLVKHGKRR